MGRVQSCTYNCLNLFYCMMLFFPFCSPFSCKAGLSNNINPATSTWKLCLSKVDGQEALQFKVKGLFPEKVQSEGWLSIGFPSTDKNLILFFQLEMSETNSVVLKQVKDVKNKANCSILGEGHRKLVSVICAFGKAMHDYVNSKKIEINWKSGNSSVDVAGAEKVLMEHHSTLLFYPRTVKQPPENAGAAAMRLLRNYGKSMGILVGISFLLTALITLTICCCCKKRYPANFTNQKLPKDASVSFYRDDSEGDGRSGESDDDDDDGGEKVAFIRNNNDRNSTV